MTSIGKFTRQEAMKLTAVSSNKLTYWEQKGLVVPEKAGNPAHPYVMYTGEQVLQLKIIQRLRERISLQEIKQVLRFLKERGYQPSLLKGNLIFVNKVLCLVEDHDFRQVILEVSGKNKGQAVINYLGNVGDVVDELYISARDQHIYDFIERLERNLGISYSSNWSQLELFVSQSNACESA
jgi:DNA-binding transcriptional MerR regulator